MGTVPRMIAVRTYDHGRSGLVRTTAWRGA